MNIAPGDVVRFFRALALLAVSACVVLPAQGWAQRDTRQTHAEITLAALPVEARHTIELVKRGGPYPYPRDGVVFGNHERLLPSRQRGYYREFTVPTPGASNRGARRIIAGGKGDEFYYTADHYRSFQRVRE